MEDSIEAMRELNGPLYKSILESVHVQKMHETVVLSRNAEAHNLKITR